MPLATGSSLTHPTLQIADFVAGITAYALANDVAAEARCWAWDHVRMNHIMADPSLSSRSSPTGKLAGQYLRSWPAAPAAGEDPLKKMPKFVGSEIISIRRGIRR